MMNKEDYVSLEVAKLLKEKGYKIPCRTSRKKNGELIMYEIEQSVDNMTSIGNECYEFLCPTLYEAQKWLLKEHNLFVFISNNEYGFYWGLNRADDGQHVPINGIQETGGHNSYEEALNAGILEALKLI